VSVNIEYFNRKLNNRDIYDRSPKNIAFNLISGPVLVEIEPGDATNYKLLLYYSPQYGLIVTIPNNEIWVKVITLNLDNYLYYPRESLEFNFNNFTETYKNIMNLSQNDWTIKFYQWYLFQVVNALLVQINDELPIQLNNNEILIRFNSED